VQTVRKGAHGNESFAVEKKTLHHKRTGKVAQKQKGTARKSAKLKKQTENHHMPWKKELLSTRGQGRERVKKGQKTTPKQTRIAGGKTHATGKI